MSIRQESEALTEKFARAPERGRLPGELGLFVAYAVMFLLVVGFAFVGYRYAHAISRINQLERQIATAPPEQRDRILGELHHEVVTAGVPGLSVAGPKGETGAASTVPGPKGDTGAASTVPGPKGEKGDKGDTVVVPSPFPVFVPGPTVTITPPPPKPSPRPHRPTDTATFGPTPSPSPCLLIVSSTAVTIGGLVCP
jgi:hypothetical protein